MSVKRHAQKAAAAGVAIATSGLSSCTDNGAVDPPPPPLQCNMLGAGESLFPTATISQDTVDVSIENRAFNASWGSVSLLDLEGVTALSLVVPDRFSNDPLTITFRLVTPATASASFTLEGSLVGFNGETCAFSRRFTMTINGQDVVVAAVSDPLPLAARQQAQISVLARSGRELLMEAQTTYPGRHDVEWTATGGKVEKPEAARTVWTVPERPGLYQIELVLDFGEAGLAVDALTIEVS